MFRLDGYVAVGPKVDKETMARSLISLENVLESLFGIVQEYE